MPADYPRDRVRRRRPVGKHIRIDHRAQDVAPLTGRHQEAETVQSGTHPLAVEAGLILLRVSSGTRYAGTSGGLLHTSGESLLEHQQGIFKQS